MGAIAFTERLELCQFTQKDTRGFFEMNNDPEVIKYTGDHAFASVQETTTFIQNYDHYQKYGYGRWSVYKRSSGQYLGFCGLKYTPEKQETDLGFRLIRQYWNKGFATEAASLALELGFGQYGLKKIVGRAMVENMASIRVLEKLGMQKKFEFEEDARFWVQYEIEAKEFLYTTKRSFPE
jgi:ribosomal-protein-alanine N-acetyltransferase